MGPFRSSGPTCESDRLIRTAQDLIRTSQDLIRTFQEILRNLAADLQ
jgi:hypothetical protein